MAKEKDDGLGILAGLAGVGGMGLLTGLMGTEDSPRDEALAYALKQIQSYMPSAQKTAYSKEQITSLVSQMKQNLGGAAKVSAGAVGNNLAEAMGSAGVPGGQAQGEMYASALAPVIAQGERDKVGADQFGMDFFNKMDGDSKQRVIQLLSVLSGISGMQSDETSGQRSVASGLQGLNLASTAYGNIMKGWKDYNHKSIEEK
jgi:hypothetical protein